MTRHRPRGIRVLKIAARLIAMSLVILAIQSLTNNSRAAESPRAGSRSRSAGDDGAEFQQTSAIEPDEPPATEPMPGPDDQQPGMEAVPPGWASAGALQHGPSDPMFPIMHDAWEGWQTKPLLVNSSSWFEPTRFYTSTDAVVLNHPIPRRSGLHSLTIDAANGDRVNENLLSLGVTGGSRVAIGYWICRTPDKWEHSVEAIYDGPENWHRAYEVIARQPGSLFNQGNVTLGGFNGADAAFFYYKSVYDSGEINLRFTRRFGRDQLVYGDDGIWKQEAEDGTTFTFLLGLRDVVLQEKFDFMARRDNVPTTVFGGEEHIRTNNNLLGLSLGSELLYHHDTWYLGIRGKGAPSLNFAEAISELTFNDATLGVVTQQHKSTHTDAAFVSDMSLFAGWQIRPRLDFHISYDFTWLTTIALAPKQLNFTSFALKTVDNNSDIFLNGASLGMGFRW